MSIERVSPQNSRFPPLTALCFQFCLFVFSLAGRLKNNLDFNLMKVWATDRDTCLVFYVDLDPAVLSCTIIKCHAHFHIFQMFPKHFFTNLIKSIQCFEQSEWPL